MEKVAIWRHEMKEAVEIIKEELGKIGATVISFIMTGHTSVYPSQVLAIKKSNFFFAKTYFMSQPFTQFMEE